MDRPEPLRVGCGCFTVVSSPYRLFRPVVSISFALNRSVSGLDPLGYGLVNVALLFGCCLAIVLLAQALSFSRPAALLCAALWAFNFHGINAAVLWISGRTALLVTLFAVLGAAHFVREAVRLGFGFPVPGDALEGGRLCYSWRATGLVGNRRPMGSAPGRTEPTSGAIPGRAVDSGHRISLASDELGSLHAGHRPALLPIELHSRSPAVQLLGVRRSIDDVQRGDCVAARWICHCQDVCAFTRGPFIRFCWGCSGWSAALHSPSSCQSARACMSVCRRSAWQSWLQRLRPPSGGRCRSVADLPRS